MPMAIMDANLNNKKMDYFQTLNSLCDDPQAFPSTWYNQKLWCTFFVNAKPFSLDWLTDYIANFVPEYIILLNVTFSDTDQLSRRRSYPSIINWYCTELHKRKEYQTISIQQLCREKPHCGNYYYILALLTLFVVQSQKAVSAYFESKQVLPSVFALGRSTGYL